MWIWKFTWCIIYIQIQAGKAVKFGAELVDSNQPTTGVYEINHVCGDKPHLFHSQISSLQARCDSEGWTVLLRRKAKLQLAATKL